MDNGQWDHDLLNALFESSDVERILCIPLSPMSSSDTIIWNGTHNGHYTVRSGYHVARQFLGKLVPMIEDRTDYWRTIWGAPVQPKVKFFLWRVRHNILPSKINLQRRGVPVDELCPVCGSIEDSLVHTFFTCSFSAKVWENSCPWVMEILQNMRDGDDLWNCLMAKAAQLGSLALMANLLWLVWHNRNHSLHELICMTPNALSLAAARHVTMVANALQTSLVPKPISRAIHWIPPMIAHYKINTDASFTASNGEAGLGVLIRDRQGLVFASATARIAHVLDPLFAEVYAIKFGITLAHFFDLKSCEFECDSLLAVKEINSTNQVLWEGGNLIDQIRFLAFLFDSCSFRHVHRNVNVFAHNLANLHCDVGNYISWCGYPLPVNWPIDLISNTNKTSSSITSIRASLQHLCLVPHLPKMMKTLNAASFYLKKRRNHAPFFVFCCIIPFVLLPLSNATTEHNINFNFTSFNPNMREIVFQGDAFSSDNAIQLTVNQKNKVLSYSAGWATYYKPMHLWDNSSGNLVLADFTTHFSFVIDSLQNSSRADGFTFFLVPTSSKFPEIYKGGGYFALENPDPGSINQFVAVEFDTYSGNPWDPQGVLDHVAIDLNTVTKYLNYTPWAWNDIAYGGKVDAFISYNSPTKELSVLLFDTYDISRQNSSTISTILDLSKVLPEWVTFGFSGATGTWFEIHTINSWNFSSSLQVPTSSSNKANPPTPPPEAATNTTTPPVNPRKKSRAWLWVVLGVTGGAIFALVSVLTLLWFFCWRDKYKHKEDDAMFFNEDMKRVTGAPREFSYKELRFATSNFTDEGLLGEGGFGKEECEQCVLHRDIKSSNVLLDLSFNAKLGDFGLARLVHHGEGSQTTILLGTDGYVAPECLETYKTIKESDIYSFGVVVLEIASGKQAIHRDGNRLKTKLVEWVWELYGRDAIFEAADPRLSENYDREQMERLLLAGLACAHPNYYARPTITKVIDILGFKAQVPTLPLEMPAPTHIEAHQATVFSSSASNSPHNTASNRTQIQLLGASFSGESSELLMMSLLFNFLTIAIFFSLIPPFTNSLSFNFTGFNTNDNNITYEKSAYPANQVIQLTTNQRDVLMTASIGRATYHKPMQLYHKASGNLTDFTTHFTFVIDSQNRTAYGDGIAFFLAPEGSKIPENVTKGGTLALASDGMQLNTTVNQFVAVEFDIYQNPWDPEHEHVGINIDSMKSDANITWWSDIRDGKVNEAWISYDSFRQNLSVRFTGFRNNTIVMQQLSLIVDLRLYLPERVTFGFSAATGNASALHQIHSWDFSSSLEIDNNITDPGVSPTLEPNLNRNRRRKNRTGLAVGLGVAGALVGGAVLVWLATLYRKKFGKDEENGPVIDEEIEDEFQRGTGPRKFTYKELSLATDNFKDVGKLGQGGFGGVYKGFLKDLNSHVAIKRVSSGSKQGIKEYASEVKIISRLRHRNLVQLIGWCHDKKELLLVYEYMPNGSLDSHLFKENCLLTWEFRYKIAHGLASGLLYLHEGWEQCVVHRDIKSSNVLLDSDFNAKLGDFGLARLVDHAKGSQTTVLAGTMGYMAPECHIAGKASKQSDTYSFGVVALEIACGRKPIEPKAGEGKVNLVEWVWELYGRGKLLEACDSRLSGEFVKEEMEQLMIVGLWCSHPDENSRPSMQQALHVLNFEAPLPILPSKMPVPTYFAPPLNAFELSYSGTDSERQQTQSSSYSYSTNSSQFTESSTSSASKSLLSARQIGLDFSFATGGFDPNDAILIVDDSTRGKSEFGEYVIRLIDPEPNGGPRKNSTGRAYSAKPFQLWDPRTKTVTDFTTSFDFAIWFSGEYNSSLSSGGLAFFITSKNSLVAPPNSAGKWLGLFNETNNGNSSNQMVAVEFDTFKDEWDPSNFHVGLNVNSIASENYIDWNENMLSNGETYHHATISYNGTSKNFSVVVKKSGHSEVLNFTYNLDLSTVLPEKAYIGFSASSGQSAAAQVIISWNFTSAMGLIEDKGFEMWKVWVIVIAILVFIAVLGLIGGIYWRNSRRNKKPNIEEQEKNSDEEDDTMDMDFAKETGPKRFTFKGLAAATGNFSEEGKLGQGGFGGVYKGYLAEENVEIAVKKVASNSKQGKKERLAKLLDHGLGSQTTVLAGTMGYLSPEYVMTSKASKESDVFSFGIVALEVACGRRAVAHWEGEIKAVLHKWVWELHANGNILEAVDEKLNGEFDEDEMRCLLSVGLWCSHPDYRLRPSIKQAIQVLNFEVPMPVLPSQMPVVLYYPTVSSEQFSYTAGSSEIQSQTTTSATISSSNQSNLFECFQPTSPPGEEVSALIYSIPLAASQSFNFTSFDANNRNIIYKGDAIATDSVIQLTKTDVWRSGHAIYFKPMHLWDKSSGSLADFTTHFSFSINAHNNVTHADGLAFFIASLQYRVPDVADGSGIGLAAGNYIINSTENPFVTVEFDTYHNFWDPDNDHVGININSLVSSKTVTWYSSVMDGKIMDAWIDYNSSSKLLNVSFTGFQDNATIQQNIHYEVDFRDYLSEWANFGFSSATGIYFELHTIHSWYFSSNLQITGNTTSKKSHTEGKKGKINIGLVVGFTVGPCVLLGGLFLIFLLLKKRNKGKKEELFGVESMDFEFEKITGAKKKTLAELVQATNNFAEGQKLGEGGFGEVYRGFLKDLNSEVAVKKISNTSRQGIKEYASEVMVTSRLRHKNLVQLVGWCHEKKELLLVYEYMSNRSLDYHLFKGERLLTWKERYKIAQDLASGLHYLHFECEPCVLHRDIKPSNVLLGSSFNAKFGDFGLARIVVHEKSFESTKCGGTFGYMAPEYASTGRASQETDVYSFGIVALEIACGRRPIFYTEDYGYEITVVEWIWELYARGNLMEAADSRLQGNFDEQQMERLMIVGLCCSHPKSNSRPSTKEVINMLNFDIAVPLLPLEMPVLNDFSASFRVRVLSSISSYATTTLRRMWTQK
ncbi:hypothetical protein CCACVL1_10296 [Corchorus capsularis]|uniref:non-specific serine/threonine protein kinase n=1 Tax=Corchorus capsularis TaxID=210143 RepID=A0A1R3IRQ9_COCAP|nr:hypothetical protein CCACVL1_10296 [Corchorus capsularis]